MMLDVKLPEHLIAHGWFVMKDGKMSRGLKECHLPNVGGTLEAWITSLLPHAHPVCPVGSDDSRRRLRESHRKL